MCSAQTFASLDKLSLTILQDNARSSQWFRELFSHVSAFAAGACHIVRSGTCKHHSRWVGELSGAQIAFFSSAGLMVRRCLVQCFSSLTLKLLKFLQQTSHCYAQASNLDMFKPQT